MPEPDIPSWLPWLAEAPLFIDATQVALFHDAVVADAFRVIQVQLTGEKSKQTEVSGGVKLSGALPKWFPWLHAEASGEAAAKRGWSQKEGEAVTLAPIETAGRRLVELALHYVANLPGRIWFHGEGAWRVPTDEEILESPRMLAFLDLPPATIFLPMAAELNDGQVVTFFDQLVDKFKQDGGTLPERYPDDTSTEEGRAQRDRYWSWFSHPDQWSANKAIQVIETQIGSGGRPRWIDYRVPIDGQTLHLHVVGRGEFDTGVFAYNLVKRGWKHGLRVVGSVKSEPDLNVLAIYEK